MNRLALFFILLIGLVGCGESKCVRTEDAGTFVSARKEPSAWNEPVIITVTTTNGTFMVLYTTISGIAGTPCEVQTHADGRQYFFVGDSRGYPIR